MAEEQQQRTLQQQAETAIGIVDLALDWSHNEESKLSPRGQQAQNQQAWLLLVQIVRQALANVEPQPVTEPAPNRQTRRQNGRQNGRQKGTPVATVADTDAQVP